jgi:glycosyltransferase involved in cell wall biosynthesis
VTLRIAYSCHDAFPSTDTNTQQIFWTLTEVARAGCRVELLVPAIVAAGDARQAIARHYGTSDDTLADGFAITAAGSSPRLTELSRGWFDWRVGRLLAPRVFDLFWTRDPVALVSALGAGRPAVFETYRPDVATAPAFALWRRRCLRHPSMLGLITHSRLARDAFVSAGVPADRVLVAHNGYAPALMEPALTRAAARASLALSLQDRLVVYTGHVDPKKGVDRLIALAARVPQARFVIVGVDEASAERERIVALAGKEGATNLLLVPRVPLRAVASYLYAADCLIIPPTDAPLRKFGRTVLPMKVFSYLAAGRPIVAPDLPDIAEVLADGVNARLVPPEDLDASARALHALLEDGAVQDRLSSGARESARAFTWAARAERVVRFLESRLAAR